MFRVFLPIVLSIAIIPGLTVAVDQAEPVVKIIDGNVWFVDKDGVKHFTCPISGETATLEDSTVFADYEGRRYYFCCPGCDETFMKDPAASVAKLTLPANVIGVSGDKLMVKCPVSSENLVVGEDTPRQVYQNRTHYFCCKKCDKKFAKSPEKYSGKKAEAGSS